MPKVMRCFSVLVLMSVAAAAQTTLYVSPAGSDSNPGTITQPLLTISKAMSLATAGTTIYLRGGTYNISSTLGAGVSGVAGNRINLWAYPGEAPILDFSGESYSSTSRGIELKRNYWYLKGLDIRNAGDNGIFISGANNIVEDCSVSYCKDTGIQISSGGSYNYIHNCDAFDNNDPATQGQNADGIDAKLAAGPGNVIRGCRVYDNADDGYDCYGTANRVVFDSCWAFHNGYNLWGIQGFTGNGNGFKLGGNDSIGPHIVTNCVSFDNVVKGFDQNNNMAGITLYNCTAFRNGTYNYSFPYAPLVGVDTLMNDLSYEAGQSDARIIAGAVVDSNSWQNHTVTDADFLSLDTSLARLPRLSDGSLPATPFLRLAPGSSLINAGINVGIAYTGSAPDIGAFESETGPVIFASNGKGGGDWDSTSTWSGGVVPDSANYVVILTGDSVIVSTLDSADAGQLTVLANGKLSVIGSIKVRGEFSMLPGAFYYNRSTDVPSFPAAGSYYIDAGSNYVHTGAAGSFIGGAGYDSTFGNVIVLRSGTTCGASLTINGSLIIETGAPTNTFLATNATLNRSLTQTVNGNVDVISGQWSCVDGGNDLTGTWNVEGNVTVGDPSTAPGTACMAPFTNSSSTHRLGIFNISGSLSFMNGARLQVGSSTTSTSTTETGLINLGGNLTIDSSASFATNSIGVFALNFVGPPSQIVTLRTPLVFSSATMQPVVNDTVSSGSSVQFTATGKSWHVNGPGAFVVNGILSLPAGDTLKGGQSFSLSDGATLGIGSSVGLDSGGPVQVTGVMTFSTKANYVYNGTAPQNTGGWLPDSVHNLTIINTGGVRMTKDVTVNGSLGVVIGELILGSNDLIAHLVNGGSPTRYVATDSTGVLKVPGVGSTQVLFPVGTLAGYAPAWVLNSSGTADTISVSVMPDSNSKADGPARVNLQWKLAASGGGSGNYALQFGWIASEEDTSFAADRSAYARIYLQSDSSTYAEAGSGSYTTQLSSSPFTVSRGGVTALGTFVVGNFGSSAVRGAESVPAVFRLFQNYPNPFNPTTTIEFTVAKKGTASLRVYNILGQEVTVLFSGEAQRGKVYRSVFDGGRFASGVYFSILESGGQRQIQKMVLVK